MGASNKLAASMTYKFLFLNLIINDKIDLQNELGKQSKEKNRIEESSILSVITRFTTSKAALNL